MATCLIVRIGGEAVALRAEAVGSVMELNCVTPVPRAAPHVVGLCALRSRVLTVIDAAAVLDGGGPCVAAGPAVVVDHEGHGYAIRVDRVDDAIETGAPQPCATALAPRWRGVAAGCVEGGDGPVLLVEPGMLLGLPAAAPAAGSTER